MYVFVCMYVCVCVCPFVCFVCICVDEYAFIVWCIYNISGQGKQSGSNYMKDGYAFVCMTCKNKYSNICKSDKQAM